MGLVLVGRADKEKELSKYYTQYETFTDSLDRYRQKNFELKDDQDRISYMNLIDLINRYNRKIQRAKKYYKNIFIGKYFNKYLVTLDEIDLEGVKIYE